jgi:hypothetical protein
MDGPKHENATDDAQGRKPAAPVQELHQGLEKNPGLYKDIQG